MKTIYHYLVIAATILTATTALISCEEEDDYIAQQLRNADWQGYVGAYYSDRWNLSGSEYDTVMHFSSKGEYYTSGRGEELNYNTRSPHRDYAYCTFKWFIVDGEITLIYDDSKWSPIYIIDYGINSNRFWGYIYDGTSRRIKFDFENTNYADWGYYGHTGSYGDFYDQNYYWSRTRSDDAAESIAPKGTTESLPIIDRTALVRQESGIADAVSVASGSFAEAMQDW